MSEICTRQHRVDGDRILHRYSWQDEDNWAQCDILNAPLKLATSRATVAIAEEKAQRAKRQEFADELRRERSRLTSARDELTKLRKQVRDFEDRPDWESQCKWMEQQRDSAEIRRKNADRRVEKYRELRDDALAELAAFRGAPSYNISMSHTERSRMETHIKDLQKRVNELEDQLLKAHDQYREVTNGTDWHAQAVLTKSDLKKMTAAKEAAEQRLHTILDGLMDTLKAAKVGDFYPGDEDINVT